MRAITPSMKQDRSDYIDTINQKVTDRLQNIMVCIEQMCIDEGTLLCLSRKRTMLKIERITENEFIPYKP